MPLMVFIDLSVFLKVTVSISLEHSSCIVLAMVQLNQQVSPSDMRNSCEVYLKYLRCRTTDWTATVDLANAPPSPADYTPLDS